MNRLTLARLTAGVFATVLALALATPAHARSIPTAAGAAFSGDLSGVATAKPGKKDKQPRPTRDAQRKAAAQAARKKGVVPALQASGTAFAGTATAAGTAQPSLGVPNYFGGVPNYANSPLP